MVAKSKEHGRVDNKGVEGGSLLGVMEVMFLLILW
jgi:hypothetical protein